MALKQAAVTVTDASGTQDLIVPLGTTVTGLLSMLDIDSTDPSLQITGADGRALDMGAVLGTDLPQGVLISITSGRERQIQEQRAIERTSDPWFRPSLVLTICGLLACAMDALLIFCALIAPRFAAKFSLPWWAMLTVGALSLLLCLFMLYQHRVHTNAGLLCAWTLSAGSSFLGLLPALGNARIYAEASQIMTMSQVAALLFPLWGATGVALGLWLWRSTPLSSAHAVSWGLLTGCATVLTFLNAPLHRVAPFAIAFAVCAITASPSLSVRIPATQLLDMPLVTTSAPTVRSPEVPSPSRITGRRVNRTVTDATSRTRLVQYVSLGLIFVGAPVIYSMVGIHSPQQIACLVLVCASVIALVVVPRERRWASSRVVPRVGALILLATLLISPASRDLVGNAYAAAALVVLGCASLMWTRMRAEQDHSPLIGRFADIFQALSLTVIFPASFFAADLFDLIRQVAS